MYENIFTSTQLKTNLREVKAAADKGIVYITENGVIEYLFMSLDIFNREIERIQAEARWGVSAACAVEWASSEFLRGDYSEVREGVFSTRAFDRSLYRPDIPQGLSEGALAIEFYSDHSDIGFDITDQIKRKKPFGDRTFKLFYGGSDIIYEQRDQTGEVLLCGLIPSIDQFKLLVREGL